MSSYKLKHDPYKVKERDSVLRKQIAKKEKRCAALGEDFLKKKKKPMIHMGALDMWKLVR